MVRGGEANFATVHRAQGDTLQLADALVGSVASWERAPFVVGDVVAPDRVWLKFRAVETSPLLCQSKPPPGDSVIIGPAPRSFWRTLDAGTSPNRLGEYFEVRVVRSADPAPWPGEGEARVVCLPRGMADPVWHFGAADVVGFFRLASVGRPPAPASVGSPLERACALTFRLERRYSGTLLRERDEVCVHQPCGAASDTGWAPNSYSTPMREGDVVFLMPDNLPEGGWHFDTSAGYGLFDTSEQRCFSVFGRGLLVDSLRTKVERLAWLRDHPYFARIEGVVMKAADRRPVSGARITWADGRMATTTDDDGRFEISGVSAGRERLHIASSTIRASCLVDASDQFSTPIQVLLPLAAPPDSSSQVMRPRH